MSSFEIPIRSKATDMRAIARTTVTAQTIPSYIYIRAHAVYDIHQACKLGMATNIPERDSQYATGEITRGHFTAVWEVAGNARYAEHCLQRAFVDMSVRYDAGIEFYQKKIIDLVEPLLTARGIGFVRLTDKEISDMVRCNRPRPDIQSLPGRPTPRPDQIDIIDRARTHFETNRRGMLVLTCGTGKTLISLWIAEAIRSRNIVIGVPNTLLLNQWADVVARMFPATPIMIVRGGVSCEATARFLRTNRSTGCIVLTTYSSSHKVSTACQSIDFQFHMKINDEVHHLTTHNMEVSSETRTYVQMLNIPSLNQLSLTATMKTIESFDRTNVVSNDSTFHFGATIATKCLQEAIDDGTICDYSLQTILADEEKLEAQFARFNISNDTEGRLWLAAFATLRSISDGTSHHALIYANTTDHTKKIIRYIDRLLADDYFDIPELARSHYQGDMSTNDQERNLFEFRNAPQGIIACVYCLGEGYDEPLIDAVVFAENMTSPIRIVQAALRASRKDSNDPEKRTKIILPVLNRDDWLDTAEDPDLKKVREVVYQMGLEDTSIEHKIRAITVDIEKPVERGEDGSVPRARRSIGLVNFGEYDEELTSKLRLKTVRRNVLGTSYSKARTIVREHRVRSIEEYMELCDKDNRLSKDPETLYRGSFVNWIEFFGMDDPFYSLEECRIKVAKYMVEQRANDIKAGKLESMDLSSISKALCGQDANFPPHGLWVDYYGVANMREIVGSSGMVTSVSKNSKLL